MLVLSRQRDEVIMIGDDIKITVIDIRGDKVRLGIDAPVATPIHREEIYKAIRREKRQQAPSGLSGGDLVGPIGSQTATEPPTPPQDRSDNARMP